MAHIYSFCCDDTLLNCLTTSQLHFDLAAREMYRGMDTRVRAKRILKEDPYWYDHFLFSEDRNTRKSAEQRFRDETYRNAISSLWDHSGFFLDSKQFPGLESLRKYLPNLTSYSWNPGRYAGYDIRMDGNKNWNRLSLELESYPEWLCGGAGISYTRRLTEE